jgi:hypothetical protein
MSDNAAGLSWLGPGFVRDLSGLAMPHLDLCPLCHGIELDAHC